MSKEKREREIELQMRGEGDNETQVTTLKHTNQRDTGRGEDNARTDYARKKEDEDRDNKEGKG